MYCDATCIVMHDDAVPIMLNVEHRNVRLHSTEPSKHQAKKVTLLKQDDNQAPGPEYISNNSYVHYDGTDILVTGFSPLASFLDDVLVPLVCCHDLLDYQIEFSIRDVESYPADVVARLLGHAWSRFDALRRPCCVKGPLLEEPGPQDCTLLFRVQGVPFLSLVGLTEIQEFRELFVVQLCYVPSSGWNGRSSWARPNAALIGKSTQLLSRCLQRQQQKLEDKADIST